MRIGEKYRVALESMSMTLDRNRHPQKKRKVGEVVYCHPKNRFAVLKFKGVHGYFRESFRPDQLTEGNLVKEKKNERKAD